MYVIFRMLFFNMVKMINCVKVEKLKLLKSFQLKDVECVEKNV